MNVVGPWGWGALRFLQTSQSACTQTDSNTSKRPCHRVPGERSVHGNVGVDGKALPTVSVRRRVIYPKAAMLESPWCNTTGMLRPASPHPRTAHLPFVPEVPLPTSACRPTHVYTRSRAELQATPTPHSHTLTHPRDMHVGQEAASVYVSG